MLDGLRGEDSIAELCRREGISQGIYYKWSKDFMEAGKKRLERFRCILGQFDGSYPVTRAGAPRRAMLLYRTRGATHPVGGYDPPKAAISRTLDVVGPRLCPVKDTARAPPSQRTGNSGQMNQNTPETL